MRCSLSSVSRVRFDCFLVCGQRTDAYPSVIGGHEQITSTFAYCTLIVSFPLPGALEFESTNDATICTPFGESRALN
jgi:hypothetical protein